MLFVDDDEIALTSLQRGLLDESYTKLFAKSGEEALEVLQRKEVHVLVTDMCMDGMSGTELIEIVSKEYPHIVTIILSGYAPNGDLLKAIHKEDIFRFVSKTLKLEEDLKPVVQQAIDHVNLRKEQEEMAVERGQCSDR